MACFYEQNDPASSVLERHTTHHDLESAFWSVGSINPKTLLLPIVVYASPVVFLIYQDQPTGAPIPQSACTPPISIALFATIAYSIAQINLKYLIFFANLGTEILSGFSDRMILSLFWND